jgi:hypothetical protein
MPFIKYIGRGPRFLDVVLGGSNPPPPPNHHSMQSASYNHPYLYLILPSFFVAENIEWCIEELAFSLSYDCAPAPLLSPVTKLSFFLILPVFHRSNLLTGMGGDGEGVGKEPNLTTN